MAIMHRMHHDPKTQSGPQTTGVTIHWISQYDLFAHLMGLGVDGSNSRLITEMAKIKPGDKVLDVGCGTGDLTLAAAKYIGATGSAYGIDAAPEEIEIARKKAQRSDSNAIFNVGLIEKLDFADATFAIVISRLVIHHLPHDLKRQGFREIYRMLKPGGLVFIADFKPPTSPLLAHLTSASACIPGLTKFN
ncbi:MAG: class I SAM-dependent methyltransferase [Chloroflexi bacterium]|nr:class I SAM-dependent methyltransferase [Chloroflexota bacterium]